MLKILISFIFVFIYGCALNKEIYTPDININGSSVIKVHMKDGSLYILNSWKVDENKRILKGNGTYYSIDRTISNVNNFEIPIDSIAIIEANEVVPSKALELLVLTMRVSLRILPYLVAASAALAVGILEAILRSACIAFYINNHLIAEGFSSSIASPIEAEDNVKLENGELSIKMKNEALETYLVRYANVSAVPKEEGSYIFATSYKVNKLISPIQAKCPQEECLNLISILNGKEWFDLADDKDLGRQEEMEVIFLAEKDKVRRQTLLPTFLFYQILDYIRNGNYEKLKEIVKKIKRIEIYYMDSEGPLTKGAVKLDYVALADIKEVVEPITIEPFSVLHNNREDKEALTSLLDKNKSLTTLPGDEYILKYKTPNGNFEFFLHTKEGIKEENLLTLWEFISFPEITLKNLAPKYKKIEPQMEGVFWRSKYVSP